jgi:hypothetical protein
MLKNIYNTMRGKNLTSVDKEKVKRLNRFRNVIGRQQLDDVLLALLYTIIFFRRKS